MGFTPPTFPPKAPEPFWYWLYLITLIVLVAMNFALPIVLWKLGFLDQ